MKFKTKENLYPNGHPVAYCYGIDDAFESFKERVEFYKKYEMNVLRFVEDYPEFREKLDIYIIEGAPCDVTWHMSASEGFKSWLFDYCFGDCIDD